ALKHNLPVTQPDKIKLNAEFRAQLEKIAPDVIVVVAYGRIIPQWMLDLPRYGNINLHGSLLPKYRGAAPIQWAVAEGECITGVTTMRLDSGLDTGDMLLARAVPVGLEETAADVYENLATVGAELLVETLRQLETGELCPEPQDHSIATLAPILTREDGRIDFTRSALQIFNRWRGFQPWPGAFTSLGGKKLIAHRMHIAEEHCLAEPGTICMDGDQFSVACGGYTTLVLDEVQLEGKRRMPAAEFLRGFQIKNGERLGQ
ncbi:MAG: methionyl-tRNA formyltransferase, partial [Acidobacteriaceae bacterium]|nr:methionyl-tRNA formyltransferase [Acidobacteriaceae bacterium]